MTAFSFWVKSQNIISIFKLASLVSYTVVLIVLTDTGIWYIYIK